MPDTAGEVCVCVRGSRSLVRCRYVFQKKIALGIQIRLSFFRVLKWYLFIISMLAEQKGDMWFCLIKLSLYPHFTRLWGERILKPIIIVVTHKKVACLFYNLF